jgi:hypothetical protein
MLLMILRRNEDVADESIGVVAGNHLEDTADYLLRALLMISLRMLLVIFLRILLMIIL